MTTAKELLSTLTQSQFDDLVDSADEFIKTGAAEDTLFRSFVEQVCEGKSVLASYLLMVALIIYHYATEIYRELLEISEVQNADPNDYRYYIS